MISTLPWSELRIATNEESKSAHKQLKMVRTANDSIVFIEIFFFSYWKTSSKRAAQSQICSEVNLSRYEIFEGHLWVSLNCSVCRVDKSRFEFV